MPNDEARTPLNLIADLEALQAHFPGEWRTGPINYNDIYGPDGEIVALVPKRYEGLMKPTARAIVATHNALPAILTAIRAAEELLFSMQCRNSYDFQNERKALRLALAALREGPR